MTKLEKLTDNELYHILLQNQIWQHIGLPVDTQNHKQIIKVINKRNKNIFEFANQDANIIINNWIGIMGETKVTNIRRIDFLDKEELATYLLTIGATNNFPNLNENPNKVTFMDLFGIPSENFLFCSVSGDSMINANILNGDNLIVDVSKTPENNDIIVVTLNDTTFVKRLKIDGDKTIFVSENPDYKPREVIESDTFRILGIVKHIIHPVR